MKGRIWTVPNQITLLRLGFLPIFLILISYEHYRWALAVLVVAGLSDGIDGLLARKLNQRSSLGAYLDPIADKLLLSSSFVILAFKKEIAWWLTIIVLSRDVLILIVAVVIILIWGYRPFPPSLLGKMTTFFQIVLVFTVVLGAAYPNALLAGIKQILIYLVAALATVSAFHYSVNIARNLSSPAHPPAKLGPVADRDNAKS
jgi:cardiolipin synthase (CMP-forming)